MSIPDWNDFSFCSSYDTWIKTHYTFSFLSGGFDSTLPQSPCDEEHFLDAMKLFHQLFIRQVRKHCERRWYETGRLLVYLIHLLQTLVITCVECQSKRRVSSGLICNKHTGASHNTS